MSLQINEISVNDVYSFFKHGDNLNGNCHYTLNNWVKEIHHGIGYHLAISDKLNIIDQARGAIWLTSNGDICYRFSPNGKTHITTLSKINMIFSNFLSCNFSLVQGVQKVYILDDELKKLQNDNVLVLYINQLLLVESEEYSPYELNEFYKNKKDGLFYRNTFKPSYYHRMFVKTPKSTQVQSLEPAENGNVYINKTYQSKQNEPEHSIILQYLYFLSGYESNRFNYILNWIASFFQDLTDKSNTTLILYGDKHSGIEILFNSIISPLFGEENCFKVTDTTLKVKSTSKTVKEKLFYNLNNISKSITENEEIKQFLQTLLPSQQRYAQTLITIQEPELYVDENSTLFHVANKLNKMYIPEWYNGADKSNIQKSDLENEIEKDLSNFVQILRLHSSILSSQTPFQGDDRNMMVSSLEDKLRIFIDAIKSINIKYFQTIQPINNELYLELENDMNINLIKQINLIQYFNTLYPDSSFDSSRTFMNALRKIDNDFFKVENAKALTGGKKYFRIIDNLH